MKSIVVSSCIVLAGLVGEAAADCTNNQVTGAALPTLLENRMVCGVRVGAAANDKNKWQEHHAGTSGGSLVDYKRGADPRDPSETVGTWSVSGNTVTHTYTGGNSYAWTVYRIGATDNYSFCDGATEVVRANISLTGIQACTTFPTP
jgi:hypothetical protein